METFKVIITSKAQDDLSEHFRFALNVSKEAASKLINEIYISLENLSTFPERNPIFTMPESFPFQVRKHVINFRYIALYTIEKDKVVIYRILDSRRKFSQIL